ncbi:MAG TPA: glycerate kinase, partial [Longimicrobiales bacterium]|nr:glycerate kinase [Longimicrobiales bacterium]
ILSCPTAFKGTIGGPAAARALADGARRARPSAAVREMPLSDGGNGLIDALVAARGGAVRTVRVTGPLGTPVQARILRMADVAVVETADANGLHLVPADRRDPMRTTTTGVGELLLAAAAGSPARIVVGVGGSATVDGGIGMAQALGWRLLDADDRPVGPGGDGLLALDAVAAPEPPRALPPITVLRDVRNPLLGPHGAAAVYGPQKGASPEDVRRLEAGLARLADHWRALGRDVREHAGAGAAGGLGAALEAFLGATLTDGASWVLDAVGFDAALADADVVLTGEGAWDAQSGMGKVVGVVLARARRASVPVLVFTGSADGVAPEGVRVVAANGRTLSEADLADMAAAVLEQRRAC